MSEKIEEKVEEKVEEKAEEMVQENSETLDQGEKQEEKQEEPKSSKKTFLKVMLISLLSLVVVYLGISAYFLNHFYYNTSVNGIDVSGCSIKATEKKVEAAMDEYEIKLTGRNGVVENIKGDAIDLNCENTAPLAETMDNQNALLWVKGFFKGQETKIKLVFSYNEDKLIAKIKEFGCMEKDVQVSPIAATPIYNEAKFEIQKENIGSKFNKEVVMETVKTYVSELETTLDFDEAGCYVAPSFTSDSEEVLDAQNIANEYLQAQITYKIGKDTEVIDAEKIASWIIFNKNMKVRFDEKEIKSYVHGLAEKYNTIGNVQKIKTPTGKVAKVSGGTYGREIDEDEEYKKIIRDIKKKTTITREPAYKQKIFTDGGPVWGKTYLEVDITEQHMWFIKKGKVVFESDVVTGTPNAERRTPQGVYTILEKMRNKVLKGRPLPNGQPSYLTPVSYWMRVTWTGVGFHDATWQAAFGGERYKQGAGSHGCINMPYAKAAELYDLIETGYPVIIHY